MVQAVDSKEGEGDVASTPCPLCRIEKEASHRIYALDKCKGGFPLPRNFYVRTHVDFTHVNKIEAM